MVGQVFWGPSKLGTKDLLPARVQFSKAKEKLQALNFIGKKNDKGAPK